MADGLDGKYRFFDGFLGDLLFPIFEGNSRVLGTKHSAAGAGPVGHSFERLCARFWDGPGPRFPRVLEVLTRSSAEHVRIANAAKFPSADCSAFQI